VASECVGPRRAAEDPCVLQHSLHSSRFPFRRWSRLAAAAKPSRQTLAKKATAVAGLPRNAMAAQAKPAENRRRPVPTLGWMRPHPFLPMTSLETTTPAPVRAPRAEEPAPEVPPQAAQQKAAAKPVSAVVISKSRLAMSSTSLHTMPAFVRPRAFASPPAAATIVGEERPVQHASPA
jgi:hypothetical protein